MWLFWVILDLFTSMVNTQAYKVVTRRSKSDGALTVLLELLGGVLILVFMPFFPIRFPTDWKIYALTAAASVFFAISDRVNTTARRGLEVSMFSIFSQLMTVFLIIFGVVFFREPLVPLKVLGAILVIGGNILILYEGRKIRFNRFVLAAVIGALTAAAGSFINIGISDQFNMPFYVMIDLCVPALIIMIAERISPRKIAEEYRAADKKFLFLTAIAWGVMILSMLCAYTFSDVSSTAPVLALSTLVNVFAAFFFQKERNAVVKKIIAAVIVVTGIILVQIA